MFLISRWFPNKGILFFPEQTSLQNLNLFLKFVYKTFIMARIAGIQVEKNTKGVLTKLHIDLKKYADDDDLINFLSKKGITSKSAGDYISKEEVKKKTDKFITGLNWKK
ncbi:MAG: hypothetical protein H7141_08605 [Burkholderiales bacterium]|nr:hypothetical protein [Bacteroidia bacterium]